MSEFDFDPVPPELRHRQTLEEARERTYSECKQSHPETHELYVRLLHLARCVDDLHDTLWRYMRDEQTHQEQLSAAWNAWVRKDAPTSRFVGDFLRLQSAAREMQPHFISALVAVTHPQPQDGTP
jgi:hypothetical protein